MNQIEKQLADFIGSILVCDAEQAYLFENLYQQGLDSFSFVELISDIERRYSVHFSDDELMSGSFRNIAGLAELIAVKRL